MKGHAEFPELEKSIDAHAKAIVSGDLQVAKSYLSANPSRSHDEFVSKIAKGSIKSFVKLGRARIGMQHMSKIRFITDGEPLLMVNRWREENGTWRIADSEDISGKRSPWSDIEVPAALRSANGAGRGAK
ncbi:MAG TPA: hypothetical protein VKV03_15950 [Candidatus Binataceae bacterium]|nr:hypothetical protein [Candidatus Binataceae bacterium]